MESDVRAGIDMHQAVLRYAEVEQYEARRRLLRLGSCDFAFDVAEEVFRAEEPEYLETVAEAVGDVFAGSFASRLDVLVHPLDCYSFFVPLPAGLEEAERTRRLRQEASLLTQTKAGEGLHLTNERLYSETSEEGEEREWFHVLGIEERTRDRLARIAKGLPRADFRPRLSMHGIASVIAALARSRAVTGPPEEPAFTLAVGWYPSHTEYTLCRGADWYFSHHTPAGSPTDCAYFAVTLLNRLELRPRAVERIYLYGNEVDASQFRLLQSIFGVEPERLNAMYAIDLETEHFTSSFNAEAYAACLGGTL